jgi:3-methyladenine DNA glycosylase AlkC
MKKDYSITKWFGSNLAELLSEKIKTVHASFDRAGYINAVSEQCNAKSYTQRIELHATELHNYLPASYPKAIQILVEILGEENANQTGMFRDYYWVLPIGKFIEKYGLEHFDISIQAIAEVTKRNTGEYAIRPFIRKYPQKTMQVMREWARSENFHLRRLASEGCRPKLPWSSKLEEFITDPQPVFRILEILVADEVKFVQKSVANNLTDYLKVNKSAAAKFINKFRSSENKNTQWILKHATRKITLD